MRNGHPIKSPINSAKKKKNNFETIDGHRQLNQLNNFKMTHDDVFGKLELPPACGGCNKHLTVNHIIENYCRNAITRIDLALILLPNYAGAIYKMGATPKAQSTICTSYLNIEWSIIYYMVFYVVLDISIFA